MSDLPEVFNSKTRKARKNHLCTSCNAKISNGEKYTYISGIWSGEPSSYKLCNNCSSIIDNFKLMDTNLSIEDGPTLDRGGIGAWLQGFMCQSWHGEEAFNEISELFGVPIEYVRRVCGS